MRFFVPFILLFLGTACVVRDKVPIKTQVVTFPDGGIVEYRGRAVGRAPTVIILPQDTNGRLVERTEVRAIPNSAQKRLFAQSRILDPSIASDRIPNQILIDLTKENTNSPAYSVESETTHVETATRSSASPARRIERRDSGKPTRPVGIDRWNPGIY